MQYFLYYIFATKSTVLCSKISSSQGRFAFIPSFESYFDLYAFFECINLKIESNQKCQFSCMHVKSILLQNIKLCSFFSIHLYTFIFFFFDVINEILRRQTLERKIRICVWKENKNMLMLCNKWVVIHSILYIISIPVPTKYGPVVK